MAVVPVNVPVTCICRSASQEMGVQNPASQLAFRILFRTQGRSLIQPPKRQNARRGERAESLGVALSGASGRIGKRSGAGSVARSAAHAAERSLRRFRGVTRRSARTPIPSPSSGVLAFWRLIPSDAGLRDETPKAVPVANGIVTIKNSGGESGTGTGTEARGGAVCFLRRISASAGKASALRRIVGARR